MRSFTLLLLVFAFVAAAAASLSDKQKKLLVAELLLKKLTEGSDFHSRGLNKDDSDSSDSSGSDSSGSSDSDSEDDAKAEILAQEQKYMDYFKEQDWDGLASLYTEDCTVYYPFTPTIHGKQEYIDNIYGSEKADNILTFKSATIIVFDDDYAIGFGDWEISENNDKTSIIGTGGFMTLYRHVDGEWLIQVDIISIGPPPVEEKGSNVLKRLLAEVQNKKIVHHPANKIWLHRE